MYLSNLTCARRIQDCLAASIWVLLICTTAPMEMIIPRAEMTVGFSLKKTMPISIATTGSMDTIMEAFPLSMYRMPAVYARLGIVVDSKPAPKIAKTTGMQSASIASFICPKSVKKTPTTAAITNV